MAQTDLQRDFSFLVASAHRSLAEQRRALPAVAEDRYERRGPLVRHIGRALDAVAEMLDESDRDFADASDDQERLGLLDAMRVTTRAVRDMQEALAWTNSSHHSEFGLGPLYFLEEAASKLIGVPVDLVTVPLDEYLYATVSWPFGRLLSERGIRLGEGPRPVVVFYPRQEASCVLLHTLLVHELGHPAVEQNDLVIKTLVEIDADESYNQEFDRAAADYAARHRKTLPAARVELQERVDSWVSELLCDALATDYLGPSYVFSFAAVVAAMSWNEPQEEHPPTTLRVAFMMRRLRARRWRRLLDDRTPEIGLWLETVAAADLSVASDYERFLVRTMTRIAKMLTQVVSELLGDAIYRPSAWSKTNVEVEEYLTDRILPAQLVNEESVDRRTILLAGWLYVLRDEGDAPTSLAKGLENTEFQAFLAKAMEMSIILETWQASAPSA